MAGLEYCVRIIEKNGFFWKLSDQEALRQIFEKVGFNDVARRAYTHVRAVTEIIEGNKSPQGVRMIHKLFANENEIYSPETEKRIREEMWAYREWLMNFFNTSLPNKVPVPVWFVDDGRLFKSRKFSLETLEAELKSAGNYSVAGLIVKKYE